MEALRIEILNPKAMQLIKGMVDLNLIHISEEPATSVKDYLEKMRHNAAEAPGLAEIAEIVEEVRTERHAKK